MVIGGTLFMRWLICLVLVGQLSGDGRVTLTPEPVSLYVETTVRADLSFSGNLNTLYLFVNGIHYVPATSTFHVTCDPLDMHPDCEINRLDLDAFSRSLHKGGEWAFGGQSWELLGDLNHDVKVDLYDYYLLQQMYPGRVTPIPPITPRVDDVTSNTIIPVQSLIPETK